MLVKKNVPIPEVGLFSRITITPMAGGKGLAIKKNRLPPVFQMSVQKVLAGVL
jgi:hypothetical protein